MLPAPYDDELFYSVVARFADRMGLRTPIAVARLLFGLDRIMPTVEFPPRLDHLIPRLLPTSPYNLASLIAKHSLVPYFTAFMAKDRAEAAQAAVLAADGVSASGRLGISTVQNPLSLRFCADCVASDTRNGYEPYWRRCHHLPGVAVCAAHRTHLIEGASVRGDEWAGFVSVARVLESGDYATPVSANARSELLVAIARASTVVLTRREPLLGGNLAVRFFERLHEAGWQHGLRISTAKIMNVARDRLGADVLADVGVHHPRFSSRTNPRLRGQSTDWLAQCLRVRGSVSHPLPYILLLTALEIDLDSLFVGTAGTEEQASRELDGPCGNPACSDVDLPVPRPLQNVSANGIFTIRCGRCGYTYRQSAQAASPRNRRIVEFGPLWDEALRRECESGKLTKLQIQDALNANIYTIKRRALDLGVWHPRWGDQTRKATRGRKDREWVAKRSVSCERYRIRWERLASRLPDAGRREIGLLDEVTYAFLRTHDADWLERTTPMIARGRGHPAEPSSDDAALAELIRDAANDISAAEPPRRITRSAIARALGKTGLRLNQERLPRSVAALGTIAESPAAFRTRRQKWDEAIVGIRGPTRPEEQE